MLKNAPMSCAKMQLPGVVGINQGGTSLPRRRAFPRLATNSRRKTLGAFRTYHQAAFLIGADGISNLIERRASHRREALKGAGKKNGGAVLVHRAALALCNYKPRLLLEV